MELRELTDDELRVFLGLLHEVVGADERYSDEEKGLVADLSREIGAERFRRAMEEARERYPDRASLKEASQQVSRQQARAAIFDVLIRASAVDGVDEEEVKPLRWLASQWSIFG
jgi:hypothetical protein